MASQASLLGDHQPRCLTGVFCLHPWLSECCPRNRGCPRALPSGEGYFEVTYLVTISPEERAASICMTENGRRRRKVDCLHLKMKTWWSVKTSATIYQSTWRNIQDDMNLYHQCCENLKYRNISGLSLKYNQQNATFFFINCSTCFRRFLRTSSGAQNCTYSVRYCQTNTAACCYRG